MECRFDSAKMTTEEFIQKAKLIHGDKYDYSKVKYTKNYNKVCIICHEKDENGIEHGEFWPTPNNHLRESGCLKCYQKSKLNSNEFFIANAKLIHGDRYDYSLVNYKGVNSKVSIICVEHGVFKQTPGNHLQSNGCPKCSKKYVNTEIFIERANIVHKNYYSYEKSEYINNTTPICITCPTHGEFWQRPASHIHNSNGCPTCSKEKNISEIKLLNLIKTKFSSVSITHQYKSNWLGLQSIDIFLDNYNIAIEYQGIQHFQSKKYYGGDENFIKTIERDERKFKLCKDNGVTLLYFTYEKYLNLENYNYTVYINEEEIISKIKDIITTKSPTKN